MSYDVLLSVRDLRIGFAGAEAVRGVSFDVRAREVFALVGESGAGKSLTARALLGMLPRGATTTGTVRPDLSGARGRRIALVPQDALSALSPVHPVGDQLAAAVRSVKGVSRREARARAVAALDRVGIPDAARAARAYPHEYSGGMRQRAVIAMACVNEPEILVADEPTTALDADRRERVLELLAEQREAAGAALVLVTHDMDAVRRHAHHVLVMYAGRAVETGPAQQILTHPRAPYTAALLVALPHPDAPHPAARRPDGPGRTDPHPADPHPDARRPDGPGRTDPHPADPHPDAPHPDTPHSADPHPDAPYPADPHPDTPHPADPHPDAPPSAGPRLARLQPGGSRPGRTRRRLPALPGTPPGAGVLPPGCAFAPRCPLVTEVCRREDPVAREVDPGPGGGRLVACHRATEVTDPLREFA
ncbi:ATP-binding cassette domain-containing protein [Streptomyces sp. NPDC051677]|uniref:ABC transporter ATP-binding protein n=1 Tax=Streptomyces sp. NPDC051677 TaxID=3365669 RepID=UPI0037CD4481